MAGAWRTRVGQGLYALGVVTHGTAGHVQDPDGFIDNGGWNFLDAEGDGSDEDGEESEEEGESCPASLLSSPAV